MTIFDTIVDNLKSLISDDIQVTISGNEGQGNQIVRVHYKRENLLTKVTYRHDLSSLGSDHESVKIYLAGLTMSMDAPWLKLPSQTQLKLSQVPQVIAIDLSKFLPESGVVGSTVLSSYESFPRTHAFIRQWKGEGKGVGLEVIVVYDIDGVFSVFESSVNYYDEPAGDRIIRLLKEKAMTT